MLLMHFVAPSGVAECFLFSENYGSGILCLSTIRLIIDFVVVEVNHDNIRYDKSVV